MRSLIVILLAMFAASCGRDPRISATDAVPGNSGRGVELILHYGCPSCHEIPGVPGADGVVGPPLTRIARRTYLAGHLVNQPVNMIQWLRKPSDIDPGTAMPDMNISAEDARDITAYLYRLN